MKKSTDPQNVQNSAKKSGKRKKIILTVALCLVFIPMIMFALGVGVYAAWAQSVPLDKTLLPTASAVPAFYAADGSLIPYAQDDYISPQDVPQTVKDAFVALEDKRFYSHKGYDVKRMFGAMATNIKAGKIKEGASTITQQLVKNTHLTQDRTLERKLKELAIAAKLEKEYEKDEILAMYLSVIYFGSGAYGIKQASRLYFDKEVSELDLAETATLAGIVKNPTKYSPKNNPDESIKRRNVVLDVMYAQSYITKEECAAAKDSPLIKRDTNDETAANVQTALTGKNTIKINECALYIKNVCKEVCAALGITDYQLNNSGLKIYTNLMPSVQKELYAQARYAGNYSDSGVESVSVVIDNAGKVCGYYSTLPYEISRQAGSTLKPLAVYAPALDMDMISLATPIVDERIDFNGFSPQNFNDVYYGNTTPRDAIKKSMNSVAVKIMDYIGTDSSAKYLDRFNVTIDDSDRNYALALGATAKGVSPLSLANAYSALANDGIYKKAYFVDYVVDGGTKIFSSPSHGGVSNAKRAVNSSTASLITSALVDTVKDGTARGLSALPFEVASKTGTVQRTYSKQSSTAASVSDGTVVRNSDAWNVSYNKEFTVLVWHGNDVGMDEKGGGHPTRHAANIWKKLNTDNSLSSRFDNDGSVVEAEVDTYSTKLNKKVTLATDNTPSEYRKREYFSASALPSSEGSKFENISPVEFSAEKNNNAVTIKFAPCEIYDYAVYRIDALGEKQIASICGKDYISDISPLMQEPEYPMFELQDFPIILGGYVEYRIECRLHGSQSEGSVSVKKVFMDNTFAA